MLSACGMTTETDESVARKRRGTASRQSVAAIQRTNTWTTGTTMALSVNPRNGLNKPVDCAAAVVDIGTTADLRGGGDLHDEI